ncbi:MAG: hypothetical protein [Bacteriophage sp.]|nr:MAG: hypothetical protein [Bacteriophage sp.]
MKLSTALTTPLSSFLKVFIATILTQYLIELQQGHQLFTLDLMMVQKLLTAGLVSVIPMLINWLNPAYQGYGKTTPDEPQG